MCWNLHLETPPLTRGRRCATPSRPPSGRKHPRLRGEDSRLNRLDHPEAETPPLTRGRPDSSGRETETKGNTPAYAGKTAVPRRCRTRRRKHPRLRGEDSGLTRTNIRSEETPPLTRGRRDESRVDDRVPGNTPAYAGKTSGGVTSGYRFQKHPRLRGEDEHFDTPRAPLQETPPLTRGRRQGGESLREALGNTPAYAGKTGRGVTLPLQAGKHPRLRGEDSVPRRVSEAGPETPPLTRGRLPCNGYRLGHHGNTPAYAGKTGKP